MVKLKTAPKKRRKRVDARATVGFDLVTYDQLQSIADARCAPIAQVVREAVAEYLADQPSGPAKSSKKG